ncbi:hypothetical protein [Proteocatella sphenisci]|uniref:hypothetical protein n=1 Tax=Proteocatella sphenisci TaxID=181070 RepID=UPI0004BA3125|nr:hypothetical protein [Proteocatella sphenisci]
MAIKYNKCPRCGSLNVIKIIYGMQTHDAFLMTEEGKIKLGSCCITDSEPEYYCKDCENEWGRQISIDKAYNEIIRIKTSVGGYFGGYFEVDIDYENRKLKWSHLCAGAEDYYEKTIRQNTLYKFIDELKMLNLLDWKSKYIEPDVCDGTQWSLEIIKSGRNIKKYGDNKFPDEWDDFCRLIRNVSGNVFS